MSNGEEIRTLEKHWRQSRRAIPVYAGMLVGAAGILWLLTRFISIPGWIIILFLGLTALTLIGDMINCLHCARRLKTLRENRRTKQRVEQA